MSNLRKTIDDIARLKSVLDGSERIPMRDNAGDLKTTFDSVVDYIVPQIVGSIRQSREIFNLELSNNVDDANNDIDIATGFALDSTYSFLMETESILTKQLDASFVAGTNQGGLFSGTKANSTTYHVFLIRKDSDGSIDAGFDTSVTATNIPAGYTAYRRIGSVMTDGSGNIIGFLHAWQDKTFLLKTRLLTKSSWQVATAGEDVALNVPIGKSVKPIGIFTAGYPAANSHLSFKILSPNQSYTLVQKDITSSTFFADAGCVLFSGVYLITGDKVEINGQYITDASGQLNFTRLGNYNSALYYSTLQTLGWIDYTL